MGGLSDHKIGNKGINQDTIQSGLLQSKSKAAVVQDFVSIGNHNRSEQNSRPMCLMVVLHQCTAIMSKLDFSEIATDYALALYALLGVTNLD